MDSDVLLIERDGPVARVTLNRPEAHNAFDERLIAALTDAFATLGADPQVRVIVLAGAGKSFCAGADLGWMRRSAAYSHDENLADARNLQRLLAALYDCPKITVASVQGAAFGGGAGLAAACDIAVAAESATFAFSEVRLGLVPAVIAPYVLQKLTPGAARALFVSGRRFPAAEAHRLGLVQHVAPDMELDATLTALLEDLRHASPDAVARTKALLRDPSPEQTVACIADARASDEGREGIAAFLEKRSPWWAEEKGEAPPAPNNGGAGGGGAGERGDAPSGTPPIIGGQGGPPK